jgi:tRNA-Thr(GGU) m(6)t(6)A37 methyltransferase TsaA
MEKIKPIGIIRSPFATKEDAPIQGAYSPDSKGQIEVFPEYADGLKDIETFSHLIIFYLFDRAGEMKLVRPTFLDDAPHGIFASRHPCRPNSIGSTVIKLTRRIKNVLEISGIDVLDKTPLIDLKPYIPRFDCFPDANEGWATSKEKRPKPPGRE